MTHHLVLIVLVGVSVAVVRAALGDRYRGQRAALQEQATVSGVDRHVQRWNRLPYVAGDGDRLTHELTERIGWEALELGDEPRILLRERVAEVMRFLSDPTFDGYLRLKTEGVVFELSLADRWRERIVRAGFPESDIEAPTAEGEARALWDLILARDGTASANRVTAISPPTVRAALGHTNSHDAILGGPVANGMTIIEGAVEPGFQYRGGPTPVSANDGHGLFFHLSFVARADGSSNAGPMYLSLYWSAPDRMWVPSRLFTDKVLGFRTLF